MSLISDALNEAQRAATKRRKEGQPTLLADNLFPPPPAVVVAPRYRPWKRVAVYVSIGVVAIASAIATGFITYRKLTSNPAPVAGALAAPSPRVVGPTANTTPQSVVGVNDPPPPRTPAPSSNRPPTASPSKGSAGVTRIPVASGAPVTAPRERAAPTEPTTPQIRKVAAAPATRDTVLPTPAGSSAARDVRIVVDPKGLRPGDSLFVRAFAEHTRGNLDAAADLYERALTSPPVSPELYNDYGALLATRGKHAAAITMYNLGIAANDNDARLWANLGDSYRAMGRRADAMSSYFEAAKLDPANIVVRLRLAGEYASLGDTATARRGFAQVVRSAPNDAEAHYRYGAFLYAQHDTTSAIRELQTFIDLAPGKYSADMIERTKVFVASLRRAGPEPTTPRRVRSIGRSCSMNCRSTSILFPPKQSSLGSV